MTSPYDFDESLAAPCSAFPPLQISIQQNELW